MGFTLIELLVALVISGLLAGVIFELIRGESRFVEIQSAREEVQQNARASVDLITGDLRAMPTSGIVGAYADSIRFRTPRVWGIFCDYLPSNAATGQAVSAATADVALLFPPGVPETFKVPTDSVALRDNSGTWLFRGATDETSSQQANAITACTNKIQPNPVPVAGQARAYTFPSAVANLVPGSRVYLYDHVAYTVGPSAGSDLYWLKRSNGGSQQPLAGPVPAPGTLPDSSRDGLHLRYYNSSGTVLTPPLAALAPVARIGITLRMESRNSLDQRREQEEATTFVYLRN